MKKKWSLVLFVSTHVTVSKEKCTDLALTEVYTS